MAAGEEFSKTLKDDDSSTSSETVEQSFVFVQSPSVLSASGNDNEGDYLSESPRTETPGQQASVCDQNLLITNPQWKASQQDQDLLISNPHSNADRRSRHSSNSSISSISSTDSISEAKYGQSHKCDYDFCLWFTSKNETEADEIFRILEKEERLRGFRLDRDKIATKYKLHNISDAIRSSWRIFLLVSPEALEDTWFENQMQQSLTHDIQKNNSGVIPILLRLDRTKCPSYLQSIFSLSYPSPPAENSRQASPYLNHDRFIATLLRIFESEKKSLRTESVPNGETEMSSSANSPSESHELPSASNSQSESVKTSKSSSSIFSMFKRRGKKRRSLPLPM